MNLATGPPRTSLGLPGPEEGDTWVGRHTIPFSQSSFRPAPGQEGPDAISPLRPSGEALAPSCWGSSISPESVAGTTRVGAFPSHSPLTPGASGDTLRAAGSVYRRDQNKGSVASSSGSGALVGLHDLALRIYRNSWLLLILPVFA